MRNGIWSRETGNSKVQRIRTTIIGGVQISRITRTRTNFFGR